MARALIGFAAAQGRVVQEDGSGQVTLSALDPNLNADRFLRLDLEDLPWPSFHRPDLFNFWYHRLLMLLVDSGMDENEAVRAILQPYDANWAPTSPLSPQQAALITAIKRKISLRPIREDHPHFDGGNPLSVPGNFPTTLTRSDSSSDPPRYNIAVPFWDAVGPWDVDNDNDGVPDSNWVDLGDPILELEDGTRYKALYSFLIIDMDSRLNVNAHGLAEQLLPPLNDVVKTTYFDPTRTMPNWPGNLTHNPNN